MHGRLKVKDSAEKAAEKAREKEKKRKKYQAGITLLFDKRAAGTHDSEGLEVCSLLLQANPDALTLWNSRRQTLLALKDEYKKEKFEKNSESGTADTVTAAATEIPVDVTSSTVEQSSAADVPLSTTTATTTATSPPATTALTASSSSSVVGDGSGLPSSWKELLSAELHVVATCLQRNPKSYGAWHHRTWVLEQLCLGANQEEQQKAWDNELNLCNLFLTKDERNFHCWDYRRLVVKQGGVPAEGELSYSLQLIERNLSNFSAWHYRAKLLPLLHPPQPGSPHPVQEDVFREELERVVQAVFTDPGDQSPWFFLRWLLQRRPPPTVPVLAAVSRLSAEQLLLVCSFTASVTAEAMPGLSMGDVVLPEVEWTSANNQKHSKVWSTVVSISDSSSVLTLQFPGTDAAVQCGLSIEEGSTDVPDGSTFTSVVWLRPPQPPVLSQASRDTLEELRENCTMLDDVDPNNKWVLLTLVEVLWALSGAQHRATAQGILSKLGQLDPLRTGYYADMKSKLMLEELTLDYTKDCTVGLSTSAEAFAASSCGLTRVDAMEVLCCCPAVTLDNNSLTSTESLACLLMCRELVLDGNILQSLAPLARLPNIDNLSINDCGIISTDLLTPLTTISTLKKLSLRSNFNNEEDKLKIRKMFEHVQHLEV